MYIPLKLFFPDSPCKTEYFYISFKNFYAIVVDHEINGDPNMTMGTPPIL